MAPSSSKLLPERRPLGVRKRILATNLASLDNVDSGAVKRRKLEEAAAARRQQRQPSIEVLDDADAFPTMRNNPPLSPSRTLEAVDGSDDINDNSDGEMPQLKAVDSSDEEDSDREKEEEGDEGELGQFVIIR